MKDPVDGDIPYAESAGENSYYIVEGTIDSSTAGEYKITVKAVDKNNVSSEKGFTVDVKDKEYKNQENSNAKTTNYNTIDNSKGAEYKKEPTNQNAQPPENKDICPNGKEPLDLSLPCDAVISGPWNQADPKMQFDSDEEAYNYGWNLFMNDNAYSDKYRDFVTAPCLRNDGSSFNIITPTLK